MFPAHQCVMLIPFRQSSLHKSRHAASFRVKGKVKFGREPEAQLSGLKNFLLLHLDNLSFSHSSSTKTLLALTGCLSAQPCRCCLRKQISHWNTLQGCWCLINGAWLLLFFSCVLKGLKMCDTVWVLCCSERGKK